MKIKEKLAAKAKDNWNAAPVTIAFLGDSVTQGCFECYTTDGGGIDTVFDGTENLRLPERQKHR